MCRRDATLNTIHSLTHSIYIKHSKRIKADDQTISQKIHFPLAPPHINQCIGDDWLVNTHPSLGSLKVTHRIPALILMRQLINGHSVSVRQNKAALYSAHFHLRQAVNSNQASPC
jgi:hypothetical protein